MRRPAGLPAALAAFERTTVMGVLNVTPDSFSDGGRWLNSGTAIAHGMEMHSRGADIVDVGGESTRPGAERVSASEELRRVHPVVAALVAAGVPVSIDTMRAEVAEACVSVGACMVNDVSSGLADPQMLPYLSSVAVPVVLMHWRGQSSRMDTLANYADVVLDVVAELRARVDAATAYGIAPERIVIDPGLGFAKTPSHNWQLLQHLESLLATGLPLLIGASRKRFLGELLAVGDEPRSMNERDDATTAITALMASQDVWGVRVHEPRSSRDAVEVVSAMRGVR
ncbi:MAG: dihydropteroate synthase [Actinobacteria bacterium]|nr:dihydropteroate synthase [Actinomycetota bacterium]